MPTSETIETLRRLARRSAYDFKRALRGPGGRSADPASIFDGIYATGAWGGDGADPNSGTGSDDEVTAPFVALVADYIRSAGVRSVVDIGCGDFRVGRQIAALGLTYTGIDVASAVVERNCKLFGSETVKFQVADATRDILPQADLCIIRQVLQHLSNQQISHILANLGSFRAVIIGEAHPQRARKYNVDKDTGGDTRIEAGSGVYLEHSPFSVRPITVLGRTPLPWLRKPGEHLTVYLINQG